jgi:DNA-directed RNA polymerase subunit RPC12/RpoP
MEKVLSYKCPSCDAPLTYDGKAEKMHCEYCDSTFEIEGVKAYNEGFGKKACEDIETELDTPSDIHGEWTEEESEHIGVFTCPSCGGELMFDENTVAASCPYCGNPAMAKHRLEGKLKPAFVLPFKVTKEEAKAALSKFAAKKKMLLPKLYLTESKLDSIRGIYIPFWLYSGKADTNAQYSAQRVFTTRTQKYDIVRTDYYRLERDGSFDFSNLAVDGASDMDDALMDSLEPFDFSAAEEFSAAYLAGYMANKYDHTSEDCLKRASDRVKGSADSLLRSTVNGYTSIVRTDGSMHLHGVDAKYVLLPAWLLVTQYKGKKYTFAMNGQTGKFIGELPVCKKRFWGFTALFTLGISVIAYILYLLLMTGGTM